MRNITLFSLSTGLSLLLAGCVTSSKYPEVSHDGLVLTESRNADAVYVLPGADIAGYERVQILEPTIAFMKGWQNDQNSGRTLNRISKSDMDKMIATGKELLREEFTKELEKGGYTVVQESGDDVLSIKPAIIDLNVRAPDPNNMSNIWVTTYAGGAGEATLYLELYDSVSGQLLLRAIDRKYEIDEPFNWRIPRTQATNINDARRAFSDWARMFVKGLDKAKAAKAD